MKTKTFGLIFLLFASVSAFAGADDPLVSFSTKGPDTYLDGTTVRDGECYALVWTRTGASFEGLAADGTAVGTNSRIVVFAPVAKNGHCPPVLFELDAELAKSYIGGTFAVYLLDTRLASGAVGGVNAQGVPAAVNGWGAVDATSSSRSVDAGLCPRQDEDGSSADGRGQGPASTVRVTTRSALPANTPQPTITAIRLVGDNVYLTVKGTLPCLKYKAQDVAVDRCARASRALGETAERAREGTSTTAAVQGAATVDEEITVIAPKKGASGLYSVQRD